MPLEVKDLQLLPLSKTYISFKDDIPYFIPFLNFIHGMVIPKGQIKILVTASTGSRINSFKRF